MTRYIIRRSLQSLFLLWMTTLIAFSIYQLAPGGPLQFLDDDPRRSAADIARLQRLYGLDRPSSSNIWPGWSVKIGGQRGRPPRAGRAAVVWPTRKRAGAASSASTSAALSTSRGRRCSG